MTRAIHILDRCIANLDRIMITDPMRPGIKFVATHRLPEALADMHESLVTIRNLLTDAEK